MTNSEGKEEIKIMGKENSWVKSVHCGGMNHEVRTREVTTAKYGSDRL